MTRECSSHKGYISNTRLVAAFSCVGQHDKLASQKLFTQNIALKKNVLVGFPSNLHGKALWVWVFDGRSMSRYLDILVLERSLGLGFGVASLLHPLQLTMMSRMQNEWQRGDGCRDSRAKTRLWSCFSADTCGCILLHSNVTYINGCVCAFGSAFETPNSAHFLFVAVAF